LSALNETISIIYTKELYAINCFNISYASFQGLDSLVEDFFLDIRVVRVYLQDASADLNTLNEAAGLEEVKSQSITDRY
jgi:hypothetical protein